MLKEEAMLLFLHVGTELDIPGQVETAAAREYNNQNQQRTGEDLFHHTGLFRINKVKTIYHRA